MRWIVLVVMAFVSTGGLAEPWLSNKAAQNCAGCHAPGRKNLQAMDRRCTLSCQGCHVSPSGGGLRSGYGKWFEGRWLGAFRPKLLEQLLPPAPYKEQPYSKGGASAAPAAPGRGGAKGGPGSSEAAAVPSMVDAKEVGVDWKLYDRRDGLEKVISKDRAEFEAQIPEGDPRRELEVSKVDGGADLRWQYYDNQLEYSAPGIRTKDERSEFFLMTGDLALRWRPVYRRYHLVYEGRYLGTPTTTRGEDRLNTLQRRALYLLIDDLPYNLYVMGGYYRPMFGPMLADHTALAEVMLSYAIQENPTAYDQQFQAYSIGGSPNVPFANVHILTKQLGRNPNDTHRGVVFNLGGRFVTLGASFAYSYWRSEKTQTVADTAIKSNLQMHSASGGLQLGPATANLDITAMVKDVPRDAFYRAMVMTFDNQIEFLRSHFLTFQYSQANAAPDLKPGSASQLRVGVRSFLISGVDLSLQYGLSSVERAAIAGVSEASDSVQKGIQGQAHLYF